MHLIIIYYLDFCSLCLPYDHFYTGLLPDDPNGNDIQKLQGSALLIFMFPYTFYPRHYEI